jgi:5-methyltetrahydropteroyltriglutamate--homocysteine methyltransferase
MRATLDSSNEVTSVDYFYSGVTSVIDVATDEVETPQRVAQVIGDVMKFVPREKIIACTNCGMAPMRREIAEGKLIALGQGVALAREKYA